MHYCDTSISRVTARGMKGTESRLVRHARGFTLARLVRVNPGTFITTLCSHGHPSLPWLLGEVPATEVFLAAQHPMIAWRFPSHSAPCGYSVPFWPISTLLDVCRPHGYSVLSRLLSSPLGNHWMLHSDFSASYQPLSTLLVARCPDH